MPPPPPRCRKAVCLQLLNAKCVGGGGDYARDSEWGLPPRQGRAKKEGTGVLKWQQKPYTANAMAGATCAFQALCYHDLILFGLCLFFSSLQFIRWLSPRITRCVGKFLCVKRPFLLANVAGVSVQWDGGIGCGLPHSTTGKTCFRSCSDWLLFRQGSALI